MYCLPQFRIALLAPIDLPRDRTLALMRASDRVGSLSSRTRYPVPRRPTVLTSTSPRPGQQRWSRPARPPAEEPPSAPGRGRRGPEPSPTAALDLALPGDRIVEILAGLDRRPRRAKTLLAERGRIVAEIDDIEAAMDAIGQQTEGALDGRTARGGGPACFSS